MGKITKRNLKANKELKELFVENEITYCENCGSTWWLTFAHRHKRIWYRTRPDLLSSENQVLLLCINCHQDIESSKQKTEELFLKLRGKEIL